MNNNKIIRFAIFCVNYNSYDELDNYIKSLSDATLRCNEVDVDVFIIDNTTDNYRKIQYTLSGLNIKVFDYHQNLGYFGAVCKAIKEVELNIYDNYIISNVDVLVDKDFFINFISNSYDENIGIIAPQIYSLNEKKNRNPGRLNRYNRKTLKVLQFLFAHPCLFSIYNNYVYKYRKPSDVQLIPMRKIYLAHGSFIILTKEFYKRCGMINYPVFLYCEEVYLAELCINNNLDTIYDPSLKVTDIDHVSTGKLKYKKYCKYNYQAVSYILDNFFKK